VPDRNEEYLLYQTLLSAWPVGQMQNPEYEDFKKRIKDYMLKAIREAKANTSWINPNTLYEDAVMTFVETVMKNTPDNQFLQDFLPFQKIISHYGMFNSLAQTLLKITSPGVPDFYQGTEMWDYSLVDPDNRRPVNYSIRVEMLQELKRRESELGSMKLAKELTFNKDDGMIKLYLIYKALNYRKAHSKLFEIGEYIPLESMGERANNICAFVRRIGNIRTIVVVPRFLTKLISGPDGLPLGKEIWKDSFIVIPFADVGAKYRNIFTGEIVSIMSHKEAIVLFLSEMFMNFPVALMEKID
jgi:(1->4)-alpha-D-glucan 1-alpha-D-glucosylmutase